MSLTQPAVPDGRPSHGLSLNLSSNNPFRRPSPAIPSPALPSPGSATSAPVGSARPVSRNPFLSEFESEFAVQPPKSPLQQAMEPNTQQKTDSGDMDAKELFNRLTLRDEGPPPGAPLARSQSRPEPGPPRRPSRSSEERRRPPPGARPPPRRKNNPEELDIFASPEKKDGRRPRRNSESSVMDRPPLSEEERRRRERRRREHEARRREGSDGRDRSHSRDKSKDDKERPRHRPSRHRKPHGLDIIDKLDVTGIYGAGLFHHDGPFDACNPHRNRKKDHRAPMQAFPAGSANMAMGGSGPVNKDIDLAKVHGLSTEGYHDYGTGYNSYKKPDASRTISFDPYSRVEPVHGEESVGLGTSTFLDGAPASRKAIERRESETEQQMAATGGLSRTKSLAQRIRGMSQPRPRFEGGPIRSPEARYNGATSPESPRQPLIKIPATTITETQSAGGQSEAHSKEQNPFDALYDEEYDKKGATIKAAEADKEKEKEVNGRDRALSSPRRPLTLERLVTTENSPEQEPKKEGFLSRVKSLKGRRPGRPT